MKKVMQTLLVMLVSFSFVATVSAKGNDTLLDYAKQTHKIAGENFNLSNGDIVKIERFLNSHEVSDEDASKIIAKGEQIIAILNREGVKDVSKLSKDVKKEIFNLAKDAASVVGVTLTYDNANKEIVAYEGSKRIDAISLNPYLKQTGSVNALTLLVTGVLVGATTLVIKRKNSNA